MPAKFISSLHDRLVIEVEIPIGRSFLECEDEIREALNEAGTLATREALKAFDADGTPIDRDGLKFSSKGRILKYYESPYGVVPLERLVFQGPRGGATFSPLDESAGILGSATPAFARIVASKYAEGGAAAVQQDLEQNHRRPASRAMIESLAFEVASRAALQGEPTRPDPPPGPERTITRAVVLLDDRPTGGLPDLPPTLIAAVRLLDRDDRLQHVSYFARVAELEHDQKDFLGDVRRHLGRVERLHPGVEVLGISGGQPDFVAILRGVARRQVLDPDRIREALAGAVAAVPPTGDDPDRPRAPRSPAEIRDWLAGVDDGLREAPEQALDRAGAMLCMWAEASGEANAVEAAEGVTARFRRWKEADLLGYGPDLPAMVLDRPGPLAELAGLLIGDRFRHTRFRMGIGRARAILRLRELTRTPERWEAFWASDAVRRPRSRWE